MDIYIYTHPTERCTGFIRDLWARQKDPDGMNGTDMEQHAGFLVAPHFCRLAPAELVRCQRRVRTQWRLEH